jgi:hypothetical protein
VKLERVFVLGVPVMTNHLGAPSLAIVDRFQVTSIVDIFSVLAVATVGPKGMTPGCTDKNVAAGLVPIAFVAVIVNTCSVPFVRPVTVLVVAGAVICSLYDMALQARV